MVKFKLTKRINPQKKDEPAKWYAIPSVVNRQTTREVCKIVTRGSTTYPTEAESTFNLVVDGIPHELQLGSSVQLGRLGWIRLSFGSEGVEDITKFDAASMIKNLKVIFTPSKELMAEIKNGLTFENVGVVEEGFTFPPEVPPKSRAAAPSPAATRRRTTRWRKLIASCELQATSDYRESLLVACSS